MLNKTRCWRTLVAVWSSTCSSSCPLSSCLRCTLSRSTTVPQPFLKSSSRSPNVVFKEYVFSLFILKPRLFLRYGPLVSSSSVCHSLSDVCLRDDHCCPCCGTWRWSALTIDPPASEKLYCSLQVSSGFPSTELVLWMDWCRTFCPETFCLDSLQVFLYRRVYGQGRGCLSLMIPNHWAVTH